MEKVNRNEHFIKNMILLIDKMDDSDIKKYIYQTEFGDIEANSLYVKCIYELKNIDNLEGIEYKKAAKDICKHYLLYAKGDMFYNTKYHTDFRKEKYKQLNLDIPKDIMEKFDYYLKKNKDTKKSVILKAINKYIEDNEKNK